MSPHDRANAYLTIPPGFADHLGRLTWSFTHDGLLDADGDTVALVEELVHVLEGVFAAPPVPPFAYVLTALHRMKRGQHPVAGAYRKHRGAAAVARNAGLLVAELCREMPAALTPPDWPDVRAALDARRRFGRPTMPTDVPAPSLSPTTADHLLSVALAKFTPEALAAWLTHGAPPAPAAAAHLAQPLAALPVRLGKLFDLARHRPRLAGAAYLAPALDAALSFPPRRHSPDALPQGGYADVTTRGHPERLLLSQFALDPDEFVRRFAERELLYFRPEEPHAPEPPDRVIVLDQGVRTWGGVRLALAGSALTLLRKHGKKFGATYLVHTGFGEPIPLETASPEVLLEALEASDLSAAPADAVIAALAAGRRDRPRDFILLTHPLSLLEAGVQTAINARRDTDRVFAVTVDAAGHAELSEWGARGPVKLRTFRVDLVAAENVSAKPKMVLPLLGTAPSAWTGDVEPIGFPFRPGVVAEPSVFGFDGPSEWLVTASRDGIVQGFSLAGEPAEVLPRAYRDGTVLKQVEAVLGVPDGVVVCGRMSLAEDSPFVTYAANAVTSREPVLISSGTDLTPAERSDWYVAAHYDKDRRAVTLYRLAPATAPVRWYVAKDRAHFGTRSVLGFVPELCVGIQCATKRRTARDRTTDWHSRTDAPPYWLPVWTKWSTEESFRCSPYLFLEDQSFEVRLVEPSWPKFEPQREGKPLLGGTVIEKAQFADGVLVLGTFCNGMRQKLVFRGPDARLVYHLPRADRGAEFALSPDGSLLAYKSRVMDVSVVETASSAPPRTVAATARLHNGLLVTTVDDPFALTVGVGDFIHTFTVEVGKFTHALRRGRPPVRARLSSVNWSDYDAARFPHKEMAESGPLTAVVDRLGQVVLLTAGGVLMSFAIRRDRAAAIAADGTCWGDVALLGCPATPGADVKLGAWLASRGGRIG